MVQTENPKFGPSVEKAAETINVWDDCRGWDNDGRTVPGTEQVKRVNVMICTGWVNVMICTG